MAIKPSKKPDGMNQDYWDARNKVAIDIHQFFKWINSEWDVRKTMGGYYRTGTCNDFKNCDPDCEGSCDCCKRSENTTHSSTTYVSVTDGSLGNNKMRKNDCPKSDDTGPVPRYIKGTCNNFNTTPSRYGKIPEGDLRKRRYNVCLPTEALGYFLTVYKRKDVGPFPYCPGPGSCEGAEQPNAEDRVQVGSTNTDSRTLEASTCGQCECDLGGDAADPEPVKVPLKCYYGSCRASFFSLASISFDVAGSWYDPETKKVHPSINLGGEYPGFGWHGQHPKDGTDKGQYGKHTTKTTVTVDGVSIPCGTSWNKYGYQGDITLSITYTLKERAL
jgi:hypothetical protein